MLAGSGHGCASELNWITIIWIAGPDGLMTNQQLNIISSVRPGLSHFCILLEP